MGKVIESFKKADFLTPPLTFMVGGRSGYESIRGAILTIVAVGACIAAGVQVTLTYLNKTDPRITSSDGFSQVSGPYNVYDNKLIPVAFLYDNKQAIIPPNVSAYFVSMGFLMWSIDVDKNVTEILTNMTACGELKTKLNARGEKAYFEDESIAIEPMFMKKILNYGICIDTDGLPRYANVSGRPGGLELPVSSLNMYFIPCTIGGGNCLDASIIEGTTVNIVSFKPLLNLKNFTHPVVYFPDTEYALSISPRLTQFNNYVLSNVQIFNNRPDIFFSPQQVASFSKPNPGNPYGQNRDASIVDCSDPSIPCVAYIYYSITATNQLTTLT